MVLFDRYYIIISFHYHSRSSTMTNRGCSRCLLAAEAHQLAGTARLLAIPTTLLKASSRARLFCCLPGRFFLF
jgi:hypothetical protein